MKKLLFLSVFFLPAYLLGVAQLFLGPRISFVELAIESSKDLYFVGEDSGAHLKGVMGGVQLGYIHQNYRGLYAYLGACYEQGELKQSSHPSRELIQVQTDGRLGVSYVSRQGLPILVTPYLGMGFQYDLQKREPWKEYPSFYYEYLTFFFPVGFRLETFFQKIFRIGFHFQWRPDLDVSTRTHSFPDRRWILKKKNGQFLVEMPIDIWGEKCSRWKITFLPFWQRLKKGVPSSQVFLTLPRQKYTYWGINLLASCSF